MRNLKFLWILELWLAFNASISAWFAMGLPSQPVSLSVEQVDELNRRLSTMRHDINNTLSLITAATELIRYKPEMAERMMVTLMEQPQKITLSLTQFSNEFQRALRITR